MRRLVALASVLGVLIFGALFIASVVHPALVESLGREIVRIEVEREVSQKLEVVDASRLGKVVERLSGRNRAEIEDIQRKFAQGVPQKIDALLAQMHNPNCPCWRFLDHAASDAFRNRIAMLEFMNERLARLVQTKYANAVVALTREFRIFTGANALVFALLGLTVALRRRANQQLALPAIALVGAAAITGGLYLFAQDWLHAIVFGDYVGFAYFGYLGLALAFMADIVFNRGRVTTLIVNIVLNAIGGALSAPC